MGWRTTMITGLMRDMLARHFAEPGNIQEADLRRLVWQDNVRTGILIESITRWRGDLVEKRPAIVIKPNGRKNVRLFLGDKTGPTEQGHMQYQTFWVGSHTLFCIHESGASTQLLADEVEQELTQFGPVVTGYLDLFRWQVTEVSGVAELEEAKENFVIPVTVGWVYDSKWRLEQESRKLRKVPLSVLLDGALLQSTN